MVKVHYVGKSSCQNQDCRSKATSANTAVCVVNPSVL